MPHLTLRIDPLSGVVLDVIVGLTQHRKDAWQPLAW